MGPLVVGAREMTVEDMLAKVVTEAEWTLESYKEDMDDWSYQENDGRKFSYEDLAPGLVAAIGEARQLLGATDE